MLNPERRHHEAPVNAISIYSAALNDPSTTPTDGTADEAPHPESNTFTWTDSIAPSEFHLSRHARERMETREIPIDALDLALRFGRFERIGLFHYEVILGRTELYTLDNHAVPQDLLQTLWLCAPVTFVVTTKPTILAVRPRHDTALASSNVLTKLRYNGDCLTASLSRGAELLPPGRSQPPRLLLKLRFKPEDIHLTRGTRSWCEKHDLLPDALEIALETAGHWFEDPRDKLRLHVVLTRPALEQSERACYPKPLLNRLWRLCDPALEIVLSLRPTIVTVYPKQDHAQHRCNGNGNGNGNNGYDNDYGWYGDIFSYDVP